MHYVQSQSRGVGSAGVCVLEYACVVDYDRQYMFDIIHCYSHMRMEYGAGYPGGERGVYQICILWHSDLREMPHTTDNCARILRILCLF